MKAKRRREQALGLAAHQVADPLRPRPFGEIVVDAHHRLARHAGRAVLPLPYAAAHGVIEDGDAARAGRGRDERLHLLVIDALELGLVIEIGDGALVRHDGEALAVERQLALDGAQRMDFDLALVGMAFERGMPGGGP